jgi:hypothetical protein
MTADTTRRAATGPGAGEGNELLDDRGARPITELEDLFDVPPEALAAPVGQLRLGV